MSSTPAPYSPLGTHHTPLWGGICLAAWVVMGTVNRIITSRAAVVGAAGAFALFLSVQMCVAQTNNPTPQQSARDRLRKSVAAYLAVNQGEANLTQDVTIARRDGLLVKLSFATLKSWTYIEGKTPIPDYIQKFDGLKVEMAGFMMPLTQTKDITEFLLMPALFGCCYGSAPTVNHIVLVKITRGGTTDFVSGPISVRGVFHAGEARENGYLVSLYRLDAEEVAEFK